MFLPLHPQCPVPNYVPPLGKIRGTLGPRKDAFASIFGVLNRQGVKQAGKALASCHASKAINLPYENRPVAFSDLQKRAIPAGEKLLVFDPATSETPR